MITEAPVCRECGGYHFYSPEQVYAYIHALQRIGFPDADGDQLAYEACLELAREVLVRERP